MPEQKNPKKESRSRESLNSYAKYSGIAVQMIVIILAGVFLGTKMDKWLHTNDSIFTAIFSVLGVVLATYSVIKDLIRKN
jgi:F0F1-type ATP synthase assembly protein I